MINTNCWRQPVPTDFMEYGGFTYTEKILLCLIFMKAQRKPVDIIHWSGNKRFDIHLNIGDCFLVGADLVRDTGISATKISRSMKLISEKYPCVKYSSNKYGYFISVLKHGEVTKMKDSKDTDETQLTYSEDTVKIPNIDKTVETDKTVKTEEKETADKPPSFPSDSKEYKFAQRFFERLQEINPTIKKPNLSRWAADFDLILRVDKRDEQQLGKVVAYALTGFWRGKVMSPKKLREKYDTLTTQMMTDTDKQGKPTAAGLAASDTELEVRVTSSGHEYVVRKDVPQGFVPPEFVGVFGLNQQKWKDRTDDGTLFFVLKEWYAKHGQNNTEFEKKYCNTPTHD